ncbi:twin-arginine translocase subunit TatC [Natronorarus salvus]|uniref:twin-arginine translocase subunit TatC n=1 Tax=Natronorarus salvus TaxID=3117733 RepID=UPI002F26A224
MGEDSEPREDAGSAAPDGGTASDGDAPESGIGGYEDAEAAAAAAVSRLDAEESSGGDVGTGTGATGDASAGSDSVGTQAEPTGIEAPEPEFEDAEAAAAAAVSRLDAEESELDEEGSKLGDEAGDEEIDAEDDTTDPYIVEEDDDTGGVGGITGPDYDQEMPLADHIEEMVKRLAVVIVVAGSVSIFILPFAVDIITFLWYSYLPSGEPPRLYGPLELLLARLKVASLGGLLIALPVAVYQTYRFMRPGLYPNERKYYLASVPISLILGICGVLFAYFVILPAIFTYFYTYSQDAGEIAFALAETFDLMLILMAYLAIIFQIPLLIMLAIMMGLTTRQWLQDKRLYFWAAFLGIAFISNPDPTGMAPFLITVTMIGLYEGTLLILKWVGR